MNELVQVKFRYLTALLQLGKGSVKRLAAFLVMVFLSAAPLIAQENPIYLTNVEGILFFYSSNPVNGLWRSDGTDAGTVLVKNINASHLTRVGRSLYFIADNNLWKSDGTAEGTVQVKSFITSANIPFHQLTDVNGVLYFYLETSVGTYELWKSNGTEAGTVMLKQFMYPPEQFAVSSVDQLRLVNGNGTLYFTAQDTTYGWELWKSDGSSAGTVLVKDIRPGVNSSAPNGLFYWNGSLYFAANDGSAAGRELWKSNGTAEGTVLVKDIAPAIQGRFGTLIVANSNPAEFTIFQGSLYFAANSSYNQFVSSQDRELWKTDGTAEGTVLVKDIAPGGAGSYPSYLTVVNGTLFFGADKEGLPEPGAGFINQELWKSDGTTAGTVLVKDFPSSDFYFTALVNMNGTLFFTFGGFSSFDRELWKSNGTAEGTVQVKDIHPNGEQLNPSSPAELTVVNNTLFFSAFDGTGRHLWKSDGTEAGTVKVKSANSATACSATGSILREYWAGIPGTALSAIPLNTTPATSTQLTSFEAPTNVGDNYGQRIRGYICAPLTGQYFFAIASDDDSELWLSTDEDPANKVKIASVSGWTNPREWTKYPSQFSQTIDLEAGKKYYIEALHKEGAGGDNLAVAWQTPSSSLTVISGTYLSPFIPEPMCTASGSILREYWANIPGTSISSIPLNTAPTTSTQLSSFEAPSYVGDNYGQRLRGYICAPESGSYTFYISGDDESELWLSTDDDPANKTLIASVSGWTYPREWTKYASQKSVAITLQKGRKYYIEALHKESIKGDNVAVGWIIPGSYAIEVIPGAVLSPFVPEPVCTASGSILREYWAGVAGTAVSAIPLNTAPTTSTQLSSFEAPSYVGDNYGQRLRGYICAPESGSYTFYISGDDESELWLSTDDDPANKTLIASVSGWTYPREWTKYASQKSVAITLQKGRKYYVEAWHKESIKGDNLAVGWIMPNASVIEIVPGSVLSPFMPATTTARLASTAEKHELALSVYPNPSTGERMQVEVSGLEGKQPLKLTLYNSMGAVILSQEYDSDETGAVSREINFISRVSSGIYILKAESNHKSVVQRIVISK